MFPASFVYFLRLPKAQSSLPGSPFLLVENKEWCISGCSCAPALRLSGQREPSHLLYYPSPTYGAVKYFYNYAFLSVFSWTDSTLKALLLMWHSDLFGFLPCLSLIRLSSSRNMTLTIRHPLGFLSKWMNMYVTSKCPLCLQNSSCPDLASFIRTLISELLRSTPLLSPFLQCRSIIYLQSS